MEGNFSNPGYCAMDLIEEGRREIFKWSEKRQTKRQGTFYKITKLFITRSLVRSFMHNLSIVVVFQMLLAAICTYSCVKLGLEMDVHMSLFVSPIVFPLAFSINANYQRRESVLEDLAMFKSSSSILFFCHRDWIKAATCLELPVDLLKTLSNKLKFLVINIREYLLTENFQKRKFILQAIYEDFSDIAQLNDKIRTSPLKSNSALVARIIHCHNLMCWSFEKLRVIREYSSPRSLRAFTKVFIFLMPLLLSPYYVFSGRQTESTWTPYYISIMVSFLFGSLQAVQDKLDDPFDGIGEDDVNLGQLDDWTTQSLLTNRTVTVGRFTVTTTTTKDDQSANTSPLNANSLEQRLNEQGSPKRTRNMSMPEMASPKLRRILSRKSERHNEGKRSTVAAMDETEFTDQLEARCHGIASKLEGMTGTSVILPGNRVPYVFQEYQGLKSPEPSTTHLSTPEHPALDENTLNIVEESTKNSERKGIGFRLNERLSVVRESDEEDCSAHGISPVSGKVLSNMKSDAVIKPEESSRSQKRPTVMGLFASLPEDQGNTHTKVSDNVFTIPDKIDEVSPTTHGISPTTRDTSPIIHEISPTTDSSEELPLLSANNASSTPAHKPESSSSFEARKASPSSSEENFGNEKASTSFNQLDRTSTRSRPGTSHSEPNSETDGVPKLRFCLVGKHGGRGKSGGVRLWGKRKQRKKRLLLNGKGQSDTELKGTTSMSPLLPYETRSESPCTDVQESSSFFEPRSENRETAEPGSPDERSVERNTADLQPIETNSLDSKPEKKVTESTEKIPQIVVNSPTEDESSLWDFDLSSDTTAETKTEENIPDTPERPEGFPSTSDGSAVSDRTSSQNVPSSHSETSIWDIPNSENSISTEPRGSRFTVSRKSNDLDSEKTGSSKPSSRFTVSPS